MASTDEGSRKSTLSLGGRRQFERKTTEASGSVQQSFSHGRKKNVAVVIKKRRTIRIGQQDTEAPAVATPVIVEEPKAPPPVCRSRGGGEEQAIFARPETPQSRGAREPISGPRTGPEG